VHKRGTITALLKDTLRLPAVAGEMFTGIRTAPTTPLGRIITTVRLMPLLEVKSLLRLDFYNRFAHVKRLFAAVADDGRPICTDSTLQRVLRCLSEEETKRFLIAFVPEIRRRSADRYQLVAGGRRRRIAVGDGSVMAGHHVCAFALLGHQNAPQLLLYDHGGFNASMFRAVRSAGMHPLVKGGESEFRNLLNDARTARIAELR